MMIKPVSILAITIVGLMSAFPSNGATMTSQIQRLLDQKEEKIKQLEECEGKKQGWMIAGISTIGLTAVGVGVNIAQANKSNKLSGEIEQSKQELERQQERLSRIEGQISTKETAMLNAQNDGGQGLGGNNQAGDGDNGNQNETPNGENIDGDANYGDNNHEYVGNVQNDDDREAIISGYCLNEVGEGFIGQVCWCDIYIPNYCAQSGKIKTDGVCSGSAHQEAGCTEFCNSKKSDLIKICDDLQE